jgi:hypothetical protein
VRGCIDQPQIEIAVALPADRLVQATDTLEEITANNDRIQMREARRVHQVSHTNGEIADIVWRAAACDEARRQCGKP